MKVKKKAKGIVQAPKCEPISTMAKGQRVGAYLQLQGYRVSTSNKDLT